MFVNISYRQMLINRLTASVLIFDCREFLLTVELHLTRVHSSFAWQNIDVLGSM